LRSIDWAKNSPDYADLIDWSIPIGLMGYSLGGAATHVNSASAHTVLKYNIGAAVALHPAMTLFSSLVEVPIFYMTASDDWIVNPYW
jgi:dienelactone hydrolase